LKQNPPRREHPDLPRRDFIKLGATGLAASVAGAAAPLHAETPRAGPTQPQQAQEPPSADDVVDPKKIPIETWQEPWVWRPEDWPDDHLELNVIRNQNPAPSTSPGVQVPTLYSYGGTSPAPTIRARGDAVVKVRVRNHMGLDRQETPVGPCPDLVDILPAHNQQVCRLVAEEAGADVDDPDNPPPCFAGMAFIRPEQAFEVIPARLIPGWANLSHANGQRTAHVTNIHTHGLHVPPNYNPDGTLSDHVLLRIIPRADWDARLASGDADMGTLREFERVGQASYAFRLGEARHGAPEGEPRQPHPPGTHWYHPHSHGSTHDQVASGMAGFFVVEGDVDELVRSRRRSTTK